MYRRNKVGYMTQASRGRAHDLEVDLIYIHQYGRSGPSVIPSIEMIMEVPVGTGRYQLGMYLVPVPATPDLGPQSLLVSLCRLSRAFSKPQQDCCMQITKRVKD